MNQPKRIFMLLLTAVFLLGALSACEPAELVVEPTTESETGAAEEDSTEALDAVYPPEPEAPAEPMTLPGASITDSGLQFYEEIPGDGPSPEDGDVVTLNFVATLPDGTEIGNSYTQGAPVTAIIGRDQLLPGWEEGVKLMQAGGSARMILPPELAFGSEGYGAIPPDSQIMLRVEIISIEAPPLPPKVAESELTTTESGLQYYDIIVGEGEEAKEGYTAVNDFVLWIDEEPEAYFVGSSQDGQPITFEIGRGDVVFPGWDEGVTGMKVGGKRLLIIPPELGMGETGAGDIPPNATLIMEIELLEVREPVAMTEVEENAYTTTESGLKYYDIVEGEGETPEDGQTVVVHYTGWLEDGTKFDSSLDRGQPFSFELGADMVIPGWDEGVATMKVGGKRQLVIPPELGYGEGGAGSMIPPNATLIFDVELLDIQE